MLNYLQVLGVPRSPPEIETVALFVFFFYYPTSALVQGGIVLWFIFPEG